MDVGAAAREPLSEAWEAEREVDTALAQALVEAACPSLRPVTVAPLAAGWDNTAYLVNGAWVFRFPRRQIAVDLMVHEIALLPLLAGRVPLGVPLPEHVGEPEARFPWPFAGYRRLDGISACAAHLDDGERLAAATPLGRFLAALHALPTAEWVARGAPGDQHHRADVAWRVPRVLGTLARVADVGGLDPALRARLEAIVAAAAAAPSRPASPPVPVHGDLYVRHLLVDTARRPSAVIDWGDLHLGERYVDLGFAFAFLPPAARERLRSAYGDVDDATWELARFRGLSHSVNMLLYAIQIGDGDLVREGRLAFGWLVEG